MDIFHQMGLFYIEEMLLILFKSSCDVNLLFIGSCACLSIQALLHDCLLQCLALIPSLCVIGG